MRGSLQGPIELLRHAVHAVLPGARQAARVLQLLLCAVLGHRLLLRGHGIEGLRPLQLALCSLLLCLRHEVLPGSELVHI